jgi:hypothetical protein
MLALANVPITGGLHSLLLRRSTGPWPGLHCGGTAHQRRRCAFCGKAATSLHLASGFGAVKACPYSHHGELPLYITWLISATRLWRTAA